MSAWTLQQEAPGHSRALTQGRTTSARVLAFGPLVVVAAVGLLSLSLCDCAPILQRARSQPVGAVVVLTLPFVKNSRCPNTLFSPRSPPLNASSFRSPPACPRGGGCSADFRKLSAFELRACTQLSDLSALPRLLTALACSQHSGHAPLVPFLFPCQHESSACSHHTAAHVLLPSDPRAQPAPTPLILSLSHHESALSSRRSSVLALACAVLLSQSTREPLAFAAARTHLNARAMSQHTRPGDETSEALSQRTRTGEVLLQHTRAGDQSLEALSQHTHAGDQTLEALAQQTRGGDEPLEAVEMRRWRRWR
mmetsp:Transcript_25888/g.52759  ORF Transcript_25888/g.52759 Transcript_25888/m.52759 type:complete len:310 (+) Transcript_25888:1681-2610(+)